ncbi:MAG: hypothetical protein A2X36_17240 [Elusimicrobia bacterium GWA2_69_24]|nr:MAG: hypothetical protein A2X36_17240 [Elusimicrobia bacterium GWA2_69_24]HBL19080.1 hypothetical protein [Elusimicrobiota bacterium]
MAKEALYLSPVPLDLAFNDPEENLRRVRAAVGSGLAAAPEVPSEERLFVFPELTLTGFVTKEPSSYALEPRDPRLERLCAVAAENRTAIAAGFPERNPADPARPFNTLALIGPDGRVTAAYRKMHLFTLGKNPETASYSAGEAGTLVSYRGWKIGLAICFDIRFAALFHAYAEAGADLILVPACWVGGEHKTYQFRTLGSAHAILSQAYVAAVNRSGKDPSFAYDGSAYVFSPFGKDLYEGKPLRLDPAELEKCRALQVRPSDRSAYPVRR